MTVPGLAADSAVVVPRVATSIAALTAGAMSRETVRPEDARSGSTFTRLEIDGERYFLKCLSYRSDWIMRVTGDRDHRTLRTWQAGLMHRMPPQIDHTVVAMALDGTGLDAVLGILMRDVGDLIIPPGDEVVDEATHRGFVDALAAMSVRYRGWRDDLGLTSMPERFRFFAPDNIAAELAGPEPDVVLRLAAQGWEQLAHRAPQLHALATAVHARPGPLTDALAGTPATFLQGDWKMGNLGRHRDGRTILLDWAYPGAGPPCWDLLWYVALNQARLPRTKPEVIDEFRDALARAGWDPAGWFDRQLALCHVGIMAGFGWEKALGPDDELGWWAERALAGAQVLDAHAGDWR